MKNNSKTKRILVIAGGCAAGLLLVFFIVYAIYRSLHPRKIEIAESIAKYPPIEHVSKGNLNAFDYSGETDALIAYMYDSNISDSVFVTYFGYESITVADRTPSVRVLGNNLLKIFEDIPEDAFPRYIVLGLDPYSAFVQSCSNSDLYRKQIAFIGELASSHPDCRFMIALPDDSAEKWTSFDEKTLKQVRASYIVPIREFSDLPNIKFYYNPMEEWVLFSDCIRENGPYSSLMYNVETHMLALNVDPNSTSRILNEDNVNEVLDDIIQRSREYKETVDSYADLSGKDVYFLGDSIFGNFRDQTAVSSFFEEMTGANVYNIGEGGVAAVTVANPSSDIGCAFGYLIGESSEDSFTKRSRELVSYYSFWLAASRLKETKGENSIFIVEYGLNDYFNGKDAEEYSDAINAIISGLKNAYPKARVLVLSPGYIHMYDDGNITQGSVGSPLQTYRDITISAAEENGCELLSLTDDFCFVEEETDLYLLPDLVHYNENGRYLLAQGLARYFNK